MARNWGHEAQRAAEARIAVLEEVQEAYCTGEEVDDELLNQLAGPVCEGCTTCTVREILDAAWPILLEAALSGEFDPLPAHGGLLDAAVTQGRVR